jgi:hypothetical protein
LSRGTVHQFTSLLFGLSSAPRVFTNLLLALLAFIRHQWVTLYAYLDDILIVGASQEEVRAAMKLSALALVWATQDLEFIGGRLRGMVFLSV